MCHRPGFLFVLPRNVSFPGSCGKGKICAGKSSRYINVLFDSKDTRHPQLIIIWTMFIEHGNKTNTCFTSGCDWNRIITIMMMHMLATCSINFVQLKTNSLSIQFQFNVLSNLPPTSFPHCDNIECGYFIHAGDLDLDLDFFRESKSYPCRSVGMRAVREIPGPQILFLFYLDL